MNETSTLLHCKKKRKKKKKHPNERIRVVSYLEITSYQKKKKRGKKKEKTTNKIKNKNIGDFIVTLKKFVIFSSTAANPKQEGL